MKVIHKNQSNIVKNGANCTAIEYPIGDKDINGAVIQLSGRFPEKGKVVNMVCKELAYITKGSGKIVTDKDETMVAEGDVVYLPAGEPYYWEGNMEMFVPCTPKWYPEQHKEVP